MSKLFISGLVNIETTLRLRQFPLNYYPIDYPFFGIHTAVSGVGYNLARAMATLGDEVELTSLTGRDFPAAYIRQTLLEAGLPDAGLLPILRETPNSVVLYDGDGNRQIHCDLKDIQEASCPFSPEAVAGADLVVACNINFNRPLLSLARQLGKPIATDVHVLSDAFDGYNRDFLENADLLFLSDEGIGEHYSDFLRLLANTYPCRLIVLGRGSRGAALYLRQENRIFEMPAVHAGPVVNTVGAGDALFAGFVHFYAQGLPPLECLRRAQWFAAAKIRVNGAGQGFVTEPQLEALMASQPE